MKLNEIHIKGFKSFDNREGQTIPLGDVTVLIGANGSGKSNVVSFFQMLNFLVARKLASFVGKYSAEALLHYGLKHTNALEYNLVLESKEILSTYAVALSPTANEQLMFLKEMISFLIKAKNNEMIAFSPEGNLETYLNDNKKSGYFPAYNLLTRIQVYQFHDTSESAKIKSRCYIDDAYFLRSDAGNLVAFLKMLKESEQYNKYYQRIIRHIQQVMPQFGDFCLDTLPYNEDYVRLNWYEAHNSEYLFGPHQISDGSLRFMALATLFLQPPDLLPALIVVDEPELGLHPSAIAELAGIIHMASEHTQVLIATQSTRLLDEFDVENVLVVERDVERKCSVVKKLDEEKLKAWLEEYSLSELWEKNVLGGKP